MCGIKNRHFCYAKNKFFCQNGPQKWRRSFPCDSDKKVKIVKNGRQNVSEVHQGIH